MHGARPYFLIRPRDLPEEGEEGGREDGLVRLWKDPARLKSLLGRLEMEVEETMMAWEEKRRAAVGADVVGEEGGVEAQVSGRLREGGR